MSDLTRRDMIRAAIAAGVGATLGGLPRLAQAVAPPTKLADPQPGVLRFAHVTDMHVTEKNRGDAGFAAALQSLDQHKPQFIITGGDHIMDALKHEKPQAATWYDMYEKTLQQNTKLPAYACIGNHDVYGWLLEQDMSADPDFGKAMALDRLKLKSRFYSFDRGGWHFVILDNIMRGLPHYHADFDPEQWQWLKADLQQNKLPAVVVTHIPILSVTGIWDANQENPAHEGYRIPNTSMHHGFRGLVGLLSRNNVKLALSGHMHMVDDIDYMGVKFCCNGAVCGRWWNGSHQEFPEGYGIVDLYPDGTVKNQYVTYGWKAPTAA